MGPGQRPFSPDQVRIQHQIDFDAVSKQVRPKPFLARNLALAFFVGGLICVVGQALNNLFVSLGMDKAAAGGRTAVTLIFIGSVLTGLGVYDQIGRFGGAGSAIPITGFANTIVAPAMEFSREGYVLGMAAQLFSVAGPVLVYGLVSAVLSAALRHVLAL